MPTLVPRRNSHLNGFDFQPAESFGYLYVGNTPTMYTDPSGLQEALPPGAKPVFQPLPAGVTVGGIIILTPERLDPRVIDEVNRILSDAIKRYSDSREERDCLCAGKDHWTTNQVA